MVAVVEGHHLVVECVARGDGKLEALTQVAVGHASIPVDIVYFIPRIPIGDCQLLFLVYQDALGGFFEYARYLGAEYVIFFRDGHE